jgi:glycosyltransferase involved in cell wall biosynthesis
MNRISVCMATRNGERYIYRQLASIVDQLEEDDEVIISDDSSTDRTIEIIEGFGDERIRLLRNNTFFSPVHNFENALKKASGEIIVLADQDDIWLDNKIAVVRERLADKVGRIYTIMMDGNIINDDGELQEGTLFEKVRAGKGILKNIYDNCYTGCSMAFTRDLLQVALPFPRKLPMHDMWLGLLSEMFGEVGFVEIKTINYRKHSDSLTDFRRRFQPLTQIKRRFFLTWNLVRRYFARKTVML